MQTASKYRWFVVAVFFAFMLLHQTDKLLIGPLTTSIMREFNLTRAQMGAVNTGALIVGAICYPLWGYLYDRYARAKLLAAASFIWGATTWLGAIAPNYTTFIAARASTGIDDSSYPGLYSLITDYFLPEMRGKIYGLLELSMPIGYLLAIILGSLLSGSLGWRGVFYLTGSLGVVLAGVIFFGVREPERGMGEPELADLEHIPATHFSWETVRDLFNKPTLRILFIQGFFGVFPWNVITYWIFNYLETERGYSESAVLATMVPAILALAAGYPLGGALGDYFFKRTPRGRSLVAATGVLVGAVMLYLTLNVPLENQLQFGIMLAATGLVIPLAAANVVATVYDVTLPEVRSTALSIQYFIESSGAALAPWVAGLIADATSLKTAFLLICIITWILCGIFFMLVARYITADTAQLRSQLRQRAQQAAG
jgi:MFS transporter, Spinster family, sphingosine-1-phosphate transporter